MRGKVNRMRNCRRGFESLWAHFGLQIVGRELPGGGLTSCRPPS